MDPIFQHPVFDLAREKMKHFIRQLEKPQEPLKTHCTLVSYVVATMYFLLQNKLGLLMREYLYSMSVMIVTINGRMDDTHHATNLQSKFKKPVYQPYRLHQTFKDMTSALSESYLAHLK